MNAIKFMLLMVLAASFSIYGQGNKCDNDGPFASETLVGKVGETQARKLKGSFKIFEELLETKEAAVFLKKAAEDFKAFGRPKNELTALLTQITYRNVYIDAITVDDKKSSRIFFSDAENPENKMILVISQNFEFLSWEEETAYLRGDVVKIPLAIVRDWPFIDGEINGVTGQWMFDTGNRKAFSLHSKKVVGLESEVVGSGFVASGQKYEVLEYPIIGQVKVGGNIHAALKKVKGNNFDFLEDISPTIIGQIGFGYFKGYDMKLDYLRSEVTFYKQKNHIENWKDIKSHKNYITSLPYFTRRWDNIPMFNIQHKGIGYLVSIDTGGGKGSFTVEDSIFEKLKNEGDLENFYDDPGTLYNWYDIKIDEHLTVSLLGMDKEDFGPSHASMQVTEKNTFTLDHSFLSEYITIWDTRNKVIHVLEKK